MSRLPLLSLIWSLTISSLGCLATHKRSFYSWLGACTSLLIWFTLVISYCLASLHTLTVPANLSDVSHRCISDSNALNSGWHEKHNSWSVYQLHVAKITVRKGIKKIIGSKEVGQTFFSKRYVDCILHHDVSRVQRQERKLEKIRRRDEVKNYRAVKKN